MPYVTSVSLFMICAGLTLPRSSGQSILNGWLVLIFVMLMRLADFSLLYYFLLWITFAVASLVFILIHGIDYVAWPKLLPPTDLIYYNGPGFRSGHHGKGFGDRILKAWSKLVPSGRPRAPSRIEEIEMGTKKRVD